MLNRRTFRRGSYAPMNMVYKSKQFGTQIWLGDYYAATDFHILKSKNINSVLTAAIMLGIVYPSQMQINHKVLNAYDMPSYKMTPHFEDAYSFIHQGLKKGNVLVHCAAGISRSTTCVLVFMMKTDGYTFNQGLDQIRKKRSFVNPNYGFQNQLKKYQLKLKKVGSKIQQKPRDKHTRQTEKEAVQKFLRGKQQQQKGQRKPQSSKMMTTLKYTSNNNNANLYGGLLRGKSVTYGTKPNSLFGQNTTYSIKNGTTKPRMMSTAGKTKVNHSAKNQNLSHLTNQFLTFKLEAPKIVTIKK